MSINELQDEVITEFSDFDDWMDRYQLLIDLGNEQEPLDEKYKTEQNLIEGCQRRGWKNYLQSRKRRFDCKRYHFVVDESPFRAYTGRNSKCRSLFY